jgi:hypothetical protein
MLGARGFRVNNNIIIIIIKIIIIVTTTTSANPQTLTRGGAEQRGKRSLSTSSCS